MTIYGAIPRGGYKQQPRRIPRSLGFARYALSFDGVDDYVDCGSDPSLKPAHLTVETWIRVDKRVGSIVSHALSSNRGWQIVFSGNWVIGQIGDGTNDYWFGLRFPDTEITIGQWHHIVLSFDGNVGRLYLDGIEKDFHSKTTTIDYGGTIICAIGALGDKTPPRFHFNGLIDEVRIYNRALSAKEIKWNMLNYHNPIRNGLVLWLPMEEGAGEIVYDKSGNGNNGTLLPAGGLGPTWERLRQWELRSALE